MNRKLESWRKEISGLAEATGISQYEVCDYLHVSHEHVKWWKKRVPVKKDTLIGIGMAYGQPLDVINDWIVRYGDKRKLYAKDALEDLVWIFLVHANADEFGDVRSAPLSDRVNYYQLYESCREKIRETYIRVWNDYIKHPRDTAEVEEELIKVGYDPEFGNLRAFVIENMDSFKTAYSKSRKMLSDYVNAILVTHTAAGSTQRTPINFLRGYLDDAMINYICGSDENIHVLNMKSKDTTVKMKPIPKLRKTHLSLCLALGMTVEEINTYLKLMGYAPLDPGDEQDGRLIQALEDWDARHPDVGRFKKVSIQDRGCDIISDGDSLQAVSAMLMLRSDLEYAYRKSGWDFPYMKG